MPTDTMVSWLLSAMVAWVPMAAHDFYQPRAATEETYRRIAEEVVEVVLEEEPLFPDGDGQEGRAQTALLLAAVASYESQYNAVVARGGSVRRGDNDNGAAVGPWQTHPYAPLLPEGWGRGDLAEDGHKAAAFALRMMRESFRACAALPVVDRLGWYAEGGAGCRPGLKSRWRVGRALRWWKAHPYEEGPGED